MKTVNIKVLLSSIFILVIIIASSSLAKAQTVAPTAVVLDNHEAFYNTPSIEVEFAVYVDNQLVNNEFELKFICNELGISVNEKISNRIKIRMDYDRLYKFAFSHSDYNTKILEIDTHAPNRRWDMELNIYLYSKSYSTKRLGIEWSPTEYTGKLAYNDSAKTFKKY